MDDIKSISGPYYELTLELKRRLEKLPYVDAFWIHGSRAVGRGTADSDIDYTVLVTDAKSQEPKLMSLLSDLIEWDEVPGFYPEQMWPVARWKQGTGDFREISLRVCTTTSLMEMFSCLFSSECVPSGSERWLEPYQDTCFLRHQGAAQFLIVESFPVYDPHGYLQDLRKTVMAYPEEMSHQLVREFVGKLKVKLMWLTEHWVPKNKYTFVSDIRDILYYIAIAHYARNRRFMQNGLKRYHVDISELKPDIKADLDRLLAVDGKFFEENKSVFLRRIIEKLEGEMTAPLAERKGVEH